MGKSVHMPGIGVSELIGCSRRLPYEEFDAAVALGVCLILHDHPRIVSSWSLFYQFLNKPLTTSQPGCECALK